LLQAYVAAGFDPAAFWSLTPRLYFVQMQGARDRLQREQRDRSWLAWHVAALMRADQIPDFTQFVEGVATKPQTPEMQKAMVLALARAWGADEVT